MYSNIIVKLKQLVNSQGAASCLPYRTDTKKAYKATNMRRIFFMKYVLIMDIFKQPRQSTKDKPVTACPTGMTLTTPIPTHIELSRTKRPPPTIWINMEKMIAFETRETNERVIKGDSFNLIRFFISNSVMDSFFLSPSDI